MVMIRFLISLIFCLGLPSSFIFSQQEESIPSSDLSLSDCLVKLDSSFSDTSINAQQWIDSGQWIIENHRVQDSSALLPYYYKHGQYLYDNKKYNKAMEVLGKALEYSHHLSPEQQSQKCKCLFQIGKTAAYARMKNRAISYYELAFSCIQNVPSPDLKAITDMRTTLINYLYNVDIYDKAIQLSYDQIADYKKLQPPPEDFLSLYTNLALCYIETDQTEKAAPILKKGTPYINKIEGEGLTTEQIRFRGAHILLLQKGNNKREDVIEYLDQWAHEFQARESSIKEKIDFYYRQAGYRGIAYQYEEALAAADSLASYNLVHDSLGQLLVPEIIKSNHAHYYNLLRAEIAYKLYLQNGDTATLKKSIESINNNFKIYDYHRRTSFDMSSRLVKLEDIYSSVQWASVIYWTALKEGLIDQDEFWRLSETQRSAHLREFKYSRELSEIYGELDSNLLSAEQMLMDSLHQFQKNSDRQQANKARYHGKLSQIMSDLYDLQQRIGEEYPDYYNQRLERKYPDLDSLQSALSSDQVLIEYMIGPDTEEWLSIYAFVISNSNIEIRELKTQNLKETVITWYNIVNKNPLAYNDKTQLIENIKRMDSLGVEIRKILLDSLDVYRFPEWIIVPHQFLHYVPFAALPLNDSISTSISSAGNTPRIIDQHQQMYSYSAQWWIEGLEQGSDQSPSQGWVLLPQKNDSKYTAGFQEARQSFGNGSWDSVYPTQENITNRLKTKHTDVLYIAAHAKYKEDTDETYIFFDTENPTSSREISRWPLQQKQVVLAACEGQMGTDSPAEGLMGLSYYFAAGGAQSITGALWEVPDKSTSDILHPHYYPDLQMGAKEIRENMLRFKANAEPLRQLPYFWAAFCTFEQAPAKPAPDLMGSSNYLLPLIALGAIYLLFILVLIWKKKL